MKDRPRTWRTRKAEELPPRTDPRRTCDPLGEDESKGRRERRETGTRKRERAYPHYKSSDLPYARVGAASLEEVMSSADTLVARCTVPPYHNRRRSTARTELRTYEVTQR